VAEYLYGLFLRCNDEKIGNSEECAEYKKTYEEQLDLFMKFEGQYERKARQRRTISAFMSQI